MARKVYQFGLRPPTIGAADVRAQLKAAQDYRNDLIAIERGRRSALRAVDDTDEVRAAIAALATAPKAERKVAVTALRLARKAAREAAAEELARISALDEQIRRDARALTTCYWGSYLDVEAANQQARAAPLYGDDAVTPNDPHFVRWHGEGHVGVQLQGGLSTGDALVGNDTRARLVLTPPRDPSRPWPRYGTLSLRVGSDGRDPVWAEWPIKIHRAVPDSASWKWVRASLRREGTRERWTVEITVDDSAASPRSLDDHLVGTVAVQWEWSAVADGAIRVARWMDDHGESGEVVLPASIATGLRKPDGIRGVRDDLANKLRTNLAKAIQESGDPLPVWLADAGDTLPHWKSIDRLHALVKRWRAERCDAARVAYDLLDAWWIRDCHLYDYEAGARREALGERREFYRVLAAQWARRYQRVLLSDQDLSREAKFGDESDVRFTASVSDLRGALRTTFADDAIDTTWKGVGSDEVPWCERAIGAWIAGGTRGDGMFAERKEKTANAWAARRAKRTAKLAEVGAARKPIANTAE